MPVDFSSSSLLSRTQIKMFDDHLLVLKGGSTSDRVRRLAFEGVVQASVSKRAAGWWFLLAIVPLVLAAALFLDRARRSPFDAGTFQVLAVIFMVIAVAFTLRWLLRRRLRVSLLYAGGEVRHADISGMIWKVAPWLRRLEENLKTHSAG